MKSYGCVSQYAWILFLSDCGERASVSVMSENRPHMVRTVALKACMLCMYTAVVDNKCGF